MSRWIQAVLVVAVLAALAAGGFWYFRGSRKANPEVRAVEHLVNRYFASWSARSMEEYQDCFHPLATITFVAPGGNPLSLTLKPFIESQREAHRAAAQPMTEAATRMDVRVHGDLAQAMVGWQLQKGGSVETGVDCFTLERTRQGWKIINLVFAADP